MEDLGKTRIIISSLRLVRLRTPLDSTTPHLQQAKESRTGRIDDLFTLHRALAKQGIFLHKLPLLHGQPLAPLAESVSSENRIDYNSS